MANNLSLFKRYNIPILWTYNNIYWFFSHYNSSLIKYILNFKIQDERK